MVYSYTPTFQSFRSGQVSAGNSEVSTKEPTRGVVINDQSLDIPGTSAATLHHWRPPDSRAERAPRANHARCNRVLWRSPRTPTRAGRSRVSTCVEQLVVESSGTLHVPTETTKSLLVVDDHGYSP